VPASVSAACRLESEQVLQDSGRLSLHAIVASSSTTAAVDLEESKSISNGDAGVLWMVTLEVPIEGFAFLMCQLSSVHRVDEIT